MHYLLEILKNKLNDDDYLLNDVNVMVDVKMYDYLFVNVEDQYLNFEINVNLNDVMVDVRGQFDFDCLGLCE